MAKAKAVTSKVTNGRQGIDKATDHASKGSYEHNQGYKNVSIPKDNQSYKP